MLLQLELHHLETKLKHLESDLAVSNYFLYLNLILFFMFVRCVSTEENKLCSLSAEPEHHTRHQRICERHPQSPRGGADEKKRAQVTYLSPNLTNIFVSKSNKQNTEKEQNFNFQKQSERNQKMVHLEVTKNWGSELIQMFYRKSKSPAVVNKTMATIDKVDTSFAHSIHPTDIHHTDIDLIRHSSH